MSEPFEIPVDPAPKPSRRRAARAVEPRAVDPVPAAEPIGLFEEPAEITASAALTEEELESLTILKRKLKAYQRSYPKLSHLDWSVLDTDDYDAIEELYNEVKLERQNTYGSGPGVVGMGYYAAMQAAEFGAKFTNGAVILDGLSVATQQNEEIKDLLTEINIEYGCYDMAISPEMRLVQMTVLTAIQLNAANQALKANPELAKKILEQQQAAQAPAQAEKVKILSDEYPDL